MTDHFSTLSKPYNCKLQLPKGQTYPMTNDDGYIEYNENFPSAAAMNKAFPAGTYKLKIPTLSDGSLNPSLTVGVEKSFAIPHIANRAALQGLDPSQAFDIQWDKFKDGTASDFVVVNIRDDSGEDVFRTPIEFEQGALPGTAVRVTIPADTLDYGRGYTGNVIFVKVTEGKQTYPGIRNGSESIHATIFRLNTISQIEPRPALKAANNFGTKHGLPLRNRPHRSPAGDHSHRALITTA